MTEQSAGSMRIKSFFAATVEQAIQEARRELGPDAMLITSRRSAPEARQFGAYEVVFGLQVSESAPRPARATTPPASAELSNELQHLRSQLQEIKSSLQGTRSVSAEPESEELFAQLVAMDLSRTVAREIVSGAAALREQLRDSLPLESYAAKVVGTKLRIAPSVAMETGKVIVFAGPAGAGKTTSLIKTAIREGLANRLPLRIVSADPYRVAAHEKLRSFAGIIGVGFTAVNSVQELKGAIEEARSKSAVVVDTPGFSAADLSQAKEMAGCLEDAANQLVHLVLPASMRRESLSRCIRDFAPFKPDCLLFTKLDETDSLGAILSTALEADVPLSFFSSGQNIPEDLEHASVSALITSVFRRETAEAVTAA